MNNKWRPHEVRGGIKIAKFLVGSLYDVNLAISRGRGNGFRLNWQTLKSIKRFWRDDALGNIGYENSKKLEDYLNALVMSEPLPLDLPTRASIDKLVVLVLGKGRTLDSLREVSYFAPEEFDPVGYFGIEKKSCLDRFDNALHAMEFLIRECANKENAKGVIIGALMSYQIAKSQIKSKQFEKLVTGNPGISWDLLIQDPESEIIEFICDTLKAKREQFEEIEERQFRLKERIKDQKTGQIVNIRKKENIIESGLQGAFLKELCATLPCDNSTH